MVRSDLIIAGSNFIFTHVNQNYSKYLTLKKKFLVIQSLHSQSAHYEGVYEFESNFREAKTV